MVMAADKSIVIIIIVCTIAKNYGDSSPTVPNCKHENHQNRYDHTAILGDDSMIP